MPTFITPFQGQAELTASSGLEIISQGHWRFSESGYNDGVTWGVSLGWPTTQQSSQWDYGPSALPVQPQRSGELYLSAVNWALPGGNALTSYTDPQTQITHGPELCRIVITGRWVIPRSPNSNSFNGQGVIYSGGVTVTDLGERAMGPVYLLDYESEPATYVIQGSAVEGGALDTFTGHEFWCRLTEEATTDNSNREFQSNSVARPAWVYAWSRSWQIN